jgi:hypothetical protein
MLATGAIQPFFDPIIRFRIDAQIFGHGPHAHLAANPVCFQVLVQLSQPHCLNNEAFGGQLQEKM